MTRFEQYVRDSVADLTKARRDELQAAYEAAKAKVDGKLAALREIADEAVKAANAKIDALARKWGWHVDESGDAPVELGGCFESNCCSRYAEAKRDYVVSNGWHTPEYVCDSVASARKALEDFDAAVERAATRLVVLKKDLGMKAEAFDAAMAEAVAKIVGKK